MMNIAQFLHDQKVPDHLVTFFILHAMGEIDFEVQCCGSV